MPLWLVNQNEVLMNCAYKEFVKPCKAWLMAGLALGFHLSASNVIKA
jgi:hypothetical protein